MTSCSRGSPVGWGRGAKGNRGRERVLLNRKVSLGKRALSDRIILLNKIVAF